MEKDVQVGSECFYLSHSQRSFLALAALRNDQPGSSPAYSSVIHTKYSCLNSSVHCGLVREVQRK